MLVTTKRSLALRCQLCGRLELNQLSLFDFSGRPIVQISCSCGFDKLTLNYTPQKEFVLQLPCLICEEIHRFTLTRGQVWENQLLVLQCPQTGQELGYWGDQHVIAELSRTKQDQLTQDLTDLSLTDFFTNPQVALEILNQLRQFAASNRLSCHCGNNQIAINIFPEKLELHCASCQSLHIIYAETYEDLHLMRQAKEITLAEKGFTTCNSHLAHPNQKP